ncbi:diguanylate cyclase (GGDEF) domain-containing protein [Cohaesibacter gelatinilyticus]|uniref:diguanylate cyclase n=2 Tax=Cohaesibacter gelatinilyticus TaxID=372072 RepID=A0A285PEA9_9HYPH|nr:diguanylate cyclase (GGDEF) domain-containing protein [Cohaesibacter gelatinilyticus]
MKVVLIESDQESSRVIQYMLESRKETVYAFSDADEAWNFIETTPNIDVILTSLATNGMTGLELCWNARILADQRKGLYVIAMSESDDAELLVEALDTGADDFLQKPLHEETLHARMRVAERMILLQRQLVHLATRDPMTNLYNRRAFFEQVHHLIDQPGQREDLCAIMFDIDHFKAVNDTYGHDVGDEVIKTVATLAAGHDGILARLGGEEFALVTNGLSILQASRVADLLRREIAETDIRLNKSTVTVTSSFGVAIYRPGESIDELLKRADMALYKSKNDGRNRVSAERPRLKRASSAA